MLEGKFEQRLACGERFGRFNSDVVNKVVFGFINFKN